ncbi:disease resistance protein PIK6-NP-like [Telopea speciosissima]|uniref:disease resistance protein PIK6-NP-like n=1 Tax=Telopea speciosissima TaxID=54955 RepID=UPI001CC3D6EE|nr:disease resistance protein PIK6-NP-like [Telopea speciosissima]
MAESAVRFLLGKLDRLLQEELKLLGQEFQSDFRYIKDELETMQAVLRDANAWEETHKTDKSLESVVHDTEDVVDKFVVRVAEQEGLHGHFRRLHKITHFIKHLRTRRRIATTILEIKTTVRDISKRRKRYKLGSAQTQAPCSNSTCEHDDTLLQPVLLTGVCITVIPKAVQCVW